jgi:hypothetical protein
MTETVAVNGWEGDEAQHWVTEADRYDGQLAPFGELLFDRLRLARALLDGAEPDARRRAIDAVIGALAECYVPERGVVLGTGAWLVSASRRRRV